MSEQTMSDYKQRMIREDQELRQRTNKLNEMLVLYREGKLDFTPTCSVDLLDAQASAMFAYLCILRERARIEHVDLNAPLEGVKSK